MENSLESIYENTINNFTNHLCRKSKVLEEGVVAYKDGTDIILEYKKTKLLVQKFIDVDNDEQYNYHAFNEFDSPIYTIDLTLENTENPLELFKEWIDAGFPTQDEIEQFTGKEFTGSIKDLRKMIRIRKSLM